jgi:hypothetical protein
MQNFLHRKDYSNIRKFLQGLGEAVSIRSTLQAFLHSR